MANGFGSLYVGSSGLQSAQNALNVVSNNLANVDTTGYVRQQVIFSDRHYLTFKDVTTKTNMQQNGLGVSIGDVVHARDIFLDKAYRLENGRQNFYDKAQEVVGQVEDLFQELNGEELKNTLKDLRTGFQQLAEAPADSVNQNLVIQQSEILLGRFDALYSDLKSYQSNLNSQIRDQVNNINDIGKRIYELNLYIQRVESAHVETAMTARDERDALLDKLSGIVNITYAEDQTGFVSVEVEGTEFIIDSGCMEMDVKTDKQTDFDTPYWPHLSDTEKNKYTYIYNYKKYDMQTQDADGNEVYRLYMDDISTDNNTDVGSLRSILYQRGSGFGTYLDLEDPKRYATIEDCTLMESEAEIDRLFHYVTTTINDLLCPNISAKDALGLVGNQTMTATDANGKTYTITADSKILDEANCTVGSDGKKPPQELFVRFGCDRYTEVTGGDGKKYYLYNEEQPSDSATWYAIGSIEINQNLLSEESLLPMITQNGAVDYALADRLQDAWDELSMTIDPTDNSPCTFEEFYDKMINKLGTDGNVYKSSSDTLTTTATGLDNKRLQVSGVSSDEELTHMIKYQAAYNAASRYITVISQMTELIVTGLI